MSTKPESTFIAGVHRHLPKHIYAMKNNNPYVGGIADCWYSARKDMWIEYKFIPKIPVRADIRPDCSALQLEWLKRRYEEGRNVAVIVGCPDGGVIFPDRSWENSISRDEFIRSVKPRADLAKWISMQTGG